MTAVGFQSDSYQLVETCLAQLRVDARLDDDPVLPTIDVLPDSDLVDLDVEVEESDLVIVCESVKELPSAATIVRETVKANRERSQKDVPTLRRREPAAAFEAPAPLPAPARPRKHARWPVVLCALVATYFGTTAFIKSPLGAKPEVQHVVRTSRAHIRSAVDATTSLVRL